MPGYKCPGKREPRVQRSWGGEGAGQKEDQEEDQCGYSRGEQEEVGRD